MTNASRVYRIMLAAFMISAWVDGAIHAQQPTSLRHVGVLQAGSWSEEMRQAFMQGLLDAGYAEGRDVAIEWRAANGNYDRLPQLAAELVQGKVDVIVVDATPSAQAAKRATSTIPIVMVLVSDPVGSGLVPSLAHPGGNVTGFSLMTAEVSVKRLELLKEAIPGLARVAVMWNPDTAFHSSVIESFKAVAPALSLKLRFVGVRMPEDFSPAFAAITRERAQILYVIDDGFMFAHRATLLKFASTTRLPIVYAATQFAKEGGLLSYGANLEDSLRRSAGYVDKILKGTKPGDLPIEQPTKFELVLNLKTAKALGITFPQSILLRADEVIR